MYAKLFFLSFFLYGIIFDSNGNHYRQMLDSALKSEKYNDILIAKLQSKSGQENIGYLGVAYVMKSNHCCFPFTKLKYFNKGKVLLDKCISSLSNNIEFVFYRYTIQKKIPRALNYNNLAEDYKRLKNYLLQTNNKQHDPDLYCQIAKIINS